MSSTLLRHPLFALALNLSALAGATYHLRSWHQHNFEEAEARMDELEGTLRGHIGWIEDSLDRIEGKPDGKKMEQLYEKRGRDEKK